MTVCNKSKTTQGPLNCSATRCIAKLKNGKSNGMDNVSSEHLKNCNPRLASMLALCFTKMFMKYVVWAITDHQKKAGNS